MLRICYSQTEARQQWTLCGQLAGPWVQELRSCWQHAPAAGSGSHTVVDLTDVTFIDESGEKLLSDMRSAEVQFVAAGVETKHLLENLKARGERPLRRFMGRSTAAATPCREPLPTEKQHKEK
jgi:anti-anti-sigma regulatory factor